MYPSRTSNLWSTLTETSTLNAQCALCQGKRTPDGPCQSLSYKRNVSKKTWTFDQIYTFMTHSLSLWMTLLHLCSKNKWFDNSYPHRRPQNICGQKYIIFYNRYGCTCILYSTLKLWPNMGIIWTYNWRKQGFLEVGGGRLEISDQILKVPPKRIKRRKWEKIWPKFSFFESKVHRLMWNLDQIFFPFLWIFGLKTAVE